MSVECVDVILFLPMNEAILKLARLSLYHRLDAWSGVASVGHVVKGALKLSTVSSHGEMKPNSRKNYVNEPRRKKFGFRALYEVVLGISMSERCFAALGSVIFSHVDTLPEFTLLTDASTSLFSSVIRLPIE